MKTQTIPFKLVGGHVLLDLDGVTTFLDTGSQVSFGSVRSLSILGIDYPIRSSMDGRITVGSVRDGLKKYAQVPKDFDFQALLGVDILAGTTVKLDWKRERLTITRNAASTVVLLKAVLPPIPRGTLMVGRKKVTAILDTGAWTSYVHPDLCRWLAEGRSASRLQPDPRWVLHGTCPGSSALQAVEWLALGGGGHAWAGHDVRCHGCAGDCGERHPWEDRGSSDGHRSGATPDCLASHRFPEEGLCKLCRLLVTQPEIQLLGVGIGPITP